MKNTSHINPLENEAIYIFREVVAQFEKPVLLFSGGKDSITLVRLAQKAFYPSKIPFPLLHIDTGHNFPETIEFRDRLTKELGLELIVRNVQDAIDQGKVKEESGRYSSRNVLQTTTLLDAIEEFKFDACIGGARRDEEKARAKERVFSIRDDFGQWDEKNQRPELFDMLNGQIELGQNVRVFPISNWTELDVWSYIEREQIEIPSIYFAHLRKTFIRDGMIWTNDDAIVFRDEEEEVEEAKSKFSKSLLKKASDIALSMSGNMTGAVKKIEKIKKGLSDDPEVKAALQLANEEVTKEIMDEAYAMNEAKDKVAEDKERYQKFFQKALKKFGVDSPAQLKGDKKKEFFDYVDANYEADDEED